MWSEETRPIEWLEGSRGKLSGAFGKALAGKSWAQGSRPSTDGYADALIPWPAWLALRFPQVASRPLAPRHERLWEWFEALTPGSRPLPRVEVWPRGGAKSSSAELGVARTCVRLGRRYVLYVSETQEQADKHVVSIAALLEALGVERAVNKYGSSLGWRRQELRTASGFNVSAFGLDTAARGVKIEQYRPDLVVFDDLDGQDDSPRTIDRKTNAITTAIIPAGSADCAYLFLQNLIHEEGVVAQLVDGRADFLHDREPAFVEPAVRGLRTEAYDRGDGQQVYRIVEGHATWAGQDLATCEAQINAWGLRAFKREAQHEVAAAGGYVFDVTRLKSVPEADLPPLVAVCLAWDLAATEGGGDWTAGVLLGKAENNTFYVLAVIRGQWASERVRACIKLTQAHYKPLWPSLTLRLPQDPGQAGKSQAQQFQTEFRGAAPRIEPVTGKKATRASGFAEAVNLGNVCMVQVDLPGWLTEPLAEAGGRALLAVRGWQAWQMGFREELRKFREDTPDQVDDSIDAVADGYNTLMADPENPAALGVLAGISARGWVPGVSTGRRARG